MDLHAKIAADIDLLTSPPPEHHEDVDPDSYDLANEDWADKRQFRLEDFIDYEQHGPDHDLDEHILGAIADMKRQRDAAGEALRALVAYARELYPTTRQTLDALAKAAGLTVSGLRVTYSDEDVDRARRITGSHQEVLPRLPIRVRATMMTTYIEAACLSTNRYPMSALNFRACEDLIRAALLTENH